MGMGLGGLEGIWVGLGAAPSRHEKGNGNENVFPNGSQIEILQADRPTITLADQGAGAVDSQGP
jgi:hypothetical protein